MFEQAEDTLDLVKTFGRKGYGDAEFIKPAYVFYDINFGESQFGVIDVALDKKNLFLYDRIGKIDFKRTHIVPQVDGYDLRLAGDGCRLVVAGYIKDSEKNPYELYSVDLFEGYPRRYLLPAHEKYDLPDNESYQREYFEKGTLPALGIQSSIDIYDDFLYYIWEARLRIIKIELKTGKKVAEFGRAAGPYKQPKATESLIRSRRSGDVDTYLKERNGMSFVKKIFAAQDHIIVVYTLPYASNDRKNLFRVQIYDPQGTFLDDIPVPGTFNYALRMDFDKRDNKLYFLSAERDYRIIELNVFKLEPGRK